MNISSASFAITTAVSPSDEKKKGAKATQRPFYLDKLENAKTAEDFLLLARYFYKSNRYDLAKQACAKVLELDRAKKFSSEALFMLAQAYDHDRDFASAAQSYARVLIEFPGASQARQALIHLSSIFKSSLREGDAAKGAYLKILSKHPPKEITVSVLKELGQTYYSQLKQYDKAFECVVHLMRIDAAMGSTALRELVTASVKDGRFDEALELYLSFVKKFPKHDYDLFSPVFNTLYEASARNPATFDASAMKMIELIRKKFPPERMQEAFFYLGKVYESNFKDYERALQIYDMVSMEAGQSKYLCYSLDHSGGIYFDELKNYTDALYKFSRIVELFSLLTREELSPGCQGKGGPCVTTSEEKCDVADALMKKGEALGKLGRHEEALSSYQKLLKIDRRTVNDYLREAAIFESAKALESTSRFEDALRMYRSIDPRHLAYNFGAMFRAARCCLLLGDASGALEFYQMIKDAKVEDWLKAAGTSTPSNSIDAAKTMESVVGLSIIFGKFGFDVNYRTVYQEPGMRIDRLGKLDAYVAFIDEEFIPAVILGKLSIVKIDQMDRDLLKEDLSSIENETHIEARYPNGITAKYLNAKKMLHRNFELENVFTKLPREFYAGIEKIIFCEIKTGDSVGQYFPKQSAFVAKERWGTQGTLIHEIMHHWDLNVAVGAIRSNFLKKTGNYTIQMYDMLLGDPSDLFYNISWRFDRSMSFYKGLPRFKDYKLREGYSNGEFAKCTRTFGCMSAPDRTGSDPCAKPISWEKIEDSDYPRKNKLEDWATISGCYSETAQALRKYVRNEMDAGVFEPAVKYLYIRYMTPFKGQEFEITDYSTSLDFAEVNKKLADYLKNDPKGVRKNTIDILHRMELFIFPPDDSTEYDTNYLIR